MRLVPSVLAALLLVSACQKEPSPPQEAVSAEEAVRRAERAAALALLPDKLQEAGTKLKKLARVYEVARELGDVKMMREADERMVTLVQKKMKAVPSQGRLKKLLKKVPSGSQAENELRKIEASLS